MSHTEDNWFDKEKNNTRKDMMRLRFLMPSMKNEERNIVEEDIQRRY